MDLSKVIEKTEAILIKAANSVEHSKRKDGPSSDKLAAYGRVLNAYWRLLLLQKRRGKPIASELDSDNMTDEEKELYGDPRFADSLSK